jgi:hypothetical protein
MEIAMKEKQNKIEHLKLILYSLTKYIFTNAVVADVLQAHIFFGEGHTKRTFKSIFSFI